MDGLFKFFLNLFPRPILIKISIWLRPALIWFFKGETFTDPIDGRSFRKLLPYGYTEQRQNALSPSTLSLERHRLLWLYLKRETDFFTSPKKVLHLAPEQCFVKLFRSQSNLDYTTADLNSPLADIRADVCNLPFEDQSFDVVICNHVLEHIENDILAMSELYRVLKPSGMGIFQVPMEQDRKSTYEDPAIVSKEDRTRHFGQYDHVRIYGIDYFERLKQVGFIAKKVDFTATLSDDEIKKFALVKGELLPVCIR